jgi:hypothetical protein
VKNLVIALYAGNAALQVGVQCHNCLPVLWCIGMDSVERDEGHDIEAVVGGNGGYSCDCDPLSEENRSLRL